MSLRILWLLLAGTVGVLAQRLPEDFDPARAAREGQALTAELLSQMPVDNYTNTGTLEIRSRGTKGSLEIPIRFTVRVHGTRWLSLYEAFPQPTNSQLNTLTIVHEPGQPSRYFQSRLEETDHVTPLSPAQVATLRFAGSDFWAGDLGLEFLHWPVQRLLKKELRRGQSCNVLESVDPNPPAGGYARVVSWLDIDTGGVVFAEAYDANRKRVKEFAPKSFKKVDGQWQLQEMRIEDLMSRSRTTLHFRVEKN